MLKKKHPPNRKTEVALTLVGQVLNRGGRVVVVNLVNPGQPAADELRRRLHDLGVPPETCDSQFMVIDDLDFVPVVRGWLAGGEADGQLVIVGKSDITTVHCPWSADDVS